MDQQILMRIPVEIGWNRQKKYRGFTLCDVSSNWIFDNPAIRDRYMIEFGRNLAL